MCECTLGNCNVYPNSMIDVIMFYIVGVNNNNICDQFILISFGWRRRRTMPPKRINWTVVVSFIILRRWRDMAMNFKIGRSWAKFTWLVVEETVEWREGYNYWLIVVDFMQIKSSFLSVSLKCFYSSSSVVIFMDYSFWLVS